MRRRKHNLANIAANAHRQIRESPGHKLWALIYDGIKPELKEVENAQAINQILKRDYFVAGIYNSQAPIDWIREDLQALYDWLPWMN